MATLETHDPAAIILTIGGNVITGFMDGTYLTVERSEDTWTLHVGSDGEVARVRNRNRSGTFVFTLQQTSPSNAVLSALASLDEQTGIPAGAAYVRDLLGTTSLGGDECFVSKPAASGFAKEMQGREWTVIVPRLDGVVGGSL